MDLEQSISNQTDVSLAIARHVSSIEAKGSNLVFSPLSLHVVVSLIAAGAKGPTLDQLLSFLKSKSTDDVNALSSELVSVIFTDGSSVGGPKLSFANGVWVDQALPLKPSFKQVVDSSYKAASYQVDFQTKAYARYVVQNCVVTCLCSLMRVSDQTDGQGERNGCRIDVKV